MHREEGHLTDQAVAPVRGDEVPPSQVLRPGPVPQRLHLIAPGRALRRGHHAGPPLHQLPRVAAHAVQRLNLLIRGATLGVEVLVPQRPHEGRVIRLRPALTVHQIVQTAHTRRPLQKARLDAVGETERRHVVDGDGDVFRVAPQHPRRVRLAHGALVRVPRVTLRRRHRDRRAAEDGPFRLRSRRRDAADVRVGGQAADDEMLKRRRYAPVAGSHLVRFSAPTLRLPLRPRPLPLLLRERLGVEPRRGIRSGAVGRGGPTRGVSRGFRVSRAVLPGDRASRPRAEARLCTRRARVGVRTRRGWAEHGVVELLERRLRNGHRVLVDPHVS